jgi:hypothetical protein
MFSDSSNSGNTISNVALYFAVTMPLLLVTLALLIFLDKGLPKGVWLRRFGQNLTAAYNSF